MISLTGVVLVFSILFLIYLYQRRKFSYWKGRGIPQLKPLFFVGDVLKVLTCQISIGDFYQEIYEKNKDQKYVGLYHLSEPCLLINDVNIIENILVKDFSSFVNRGLPPPNLKSDVDFGLPQLRDVMWRGLRYKMTPAFSSGKLKLMFENMKPCSQNSISYLDSLPRDNVDIKDITTRFALDVIGSCAFGLDVTKDTDSNSKFRTMGQKIIAQSKIGYLFQLLLLFAPKIAEKFGVMFTNDKVGRYFAQIIKDTIKMRIDSKLKRNDFIEHILQIKQQGKITVHNKDPEDKYLEMENVAPSESFEITDPMLISQAFTFLSAGFDGISTPTVCILHQLAKYKPYQQRCRDELQAQIDRYGSLTYEALKHATFLDRCINEGLRLYPLSQFLFRETNKDYEIEDGIWLKAGTKVIISNSGLQMDSNYHPDPHTFNPERTDSGLSANVTDFTNLPFGAGPRICIGMRMAQLIVKLYLATLIINYDISLSPRCPQDIKLKTASFIAALQDTLYFSVKKLPTK